MLDSWENVEREIKLGHRWWTVGAIEAAADQVFWPKGLAGLLRPLVRGEIPGEPLALEH